MDVRLIAWSVVQKFMGDEEVEMRHQALES